MSENSFLADYLGQFKEQMQTLQEEISGMRKALSELVQFEGRVDDVTEKVHELEERLDKIVPIVNRLESIFKVFVQIGKWVFIVSSIAGGAWLINFLKLGG